MFCLCFGVLYSFNHLEVEMRAGCFVLSYGCLVTVNVLWLFLTVTWIGMQWVIVVFPDQTYFLFDQSQLIGQNSISGI